MVRLFRVVAVTALVAVLQVGPAFGQAASATIRGLVRDSQGRPVPSATVTVTGRETGLTRTVPTGADGTFVVANLPPAVVDLTVTASGFGDATHGNIVLEVGQAVTVDIGLAVVSLTAAACGQSVDGRFVEGLRQRQLFVRALARCSNRCPRKAGDALSSSRSNNNHRHRMDRAQCDCQPLATSPLPGETHPLSQWDYLN